jgi:hypothetical protein
MSVRFSEFGDPDEWYEQWGDYVPSWVEAQHSHVIRFIG